MSDIKIEEDSKTTPPVVSNEIWKVFSNVDPVTGDDLDWIEVRDYLCEHGPAKSLDRLYDYYLENFHRMDPWSVYLLTCSHFTLEELEGEKYNRAYRRRLEQRVIKLMKKREQDKSTPYQEFLYKNRNL